jgi:hypothetical protein
MLTDRTHLYVQSADLCGAHKRWNMSKRRAIAQAALSVRFKKWIFAFPAQVGFGSKAEVRSYAWQVRSVPQADIGALRLSRWLPHLDGESAIFLTICV